MILFSNLDRLQHQLKQIPEAEQQNLRLNIEPYPATTRIAQNSIAIEI